MGQDNADDFLIAALGASAGGLEPLETFFKHMPAEAGVAFVIVQHLSPDHATALPQLLGRQTEMPVEQARDKMTVVPNRVYVIPPNATLTIKDGVLQVTPPVGARGARAPIDSFFASLAEDRGENAVCIILSGTGSDGTVGLRAIKEHSGMALAQTLDSAKYDSILRSAIATGLVDHVLPVEEMPAKLQEYAAHLALLNGQPDHINAQIGVHMGRIHQALRKRAGHDFSQYKESTIARRLERRMKAAQIESVEQYVELLERKPEEVDRLFNDLLIGVTQFFRDAEAFEALGREVIPKLFKDKETGGEVRVCVVGCSSGEEAYSIAILLLEHAATVNHAPRLQIFATDIDERALETARKGCYPEIIAEHISPQRLARFFIKEDGTYQVKRELREICLFSVHSFIKDPPFSRLDLISSRNVMIYLGQDLQKKIIPLFHYALRPGGYLFLGASESATAQFFRTVDKKHRIFQRKELLPRPVVAFPLADVNRQSAGGNRPETEVPNLPRQLERIILQRYRPACVTVRENGDGVYFSGRISQYLEQPTGIPEANVINMAREGLRIPLRTALHKAVTSRERVVQKQIPVQTNGGISHLDLTVEPLADFRPADLYMIVFEEVPARLGSSQTAVPLLGPDAGAEEAIRHLEDELRAAQEHAQTMFEELESSNEELKSANEEYQSANEELETSKEELQSLNEELQTVNAEVSRKVAELDQANSDLQNLLNSTQIATIFLDRELHIRNFTPAAGSVFRLIASDIGRPITDLAAQFADVDLVSDINEVLRTLAECERELAGTGGRHYMLRVLPYRSVLNAIEGVVLTFTDVTQARQAAQTLAEAKAYAESIIETVRDSLLVLDARARVKSANEAFYRMFEVSPAQTLGIPLYDLGNGQWDIPELRRLITDLLPAKRTIEDFEVEHKFPGIGRRIMRLNARPIVRQSDQESLILLAIEDITERKREEEALRRSEERNHTLVSVITDVPWTADAEGRFTDEQSAWSAFTGQGWDEHRDFGWVNAMHPDDRSQIQELWRRACESGTTFRSQGRVWHSASRQYHYFEACAQPLLNRDGSVREWVGTITDVDQERRSEMLLEKLNANLKHFAYAASHDLQEPLRMVMSYTHLLSRTYKGKLDSQADQFIAYAVDGAERMEALLRDLREYWSVDEQRIEELIPVDCNRVLEKTLAQLIVSVQESGATVTHQPLPTVLAEELPLTLLFQNLIGNAIKYRRPETAPLIHLAAERNGTLWNFSVADNGLGIEGRHLQTIFAPFKRLHGREYPGTGLGLAMCQKIVERYGGRIWAESSHGEGSVFHFTLPAQGGDA